MLTFINSQKRAQRAVDSLGWPRIAVLKHTHIAAAASLVCMHPAEEGPGRPSSNSQALRIEDRQTERVNTEGYNAMWTPSAGHCLITIDGFGELRNELIFRDALLLRRIPVTDCHSAILQGVKIHCHAERDPSLVPSAVAPANGPCDVHRAVPAHPQALKKVLGTAHNVLVILDKGQHQHLHRGNFGRETQHRALFPPDLVLIVGRAEYGQEQPVNTQTWLNNVWNKLRLRLLVIDLELAPRGICVLGQVVAPTGRNPQKLLLPEGKMEREICAGPGIVRKLVLSMHLSANQLRPQSTSLHEELVHGVQPFLMAALPVVFLNEILDLHLLKFTRSENKVAGRDLIAERLPDLGDAEGQTHPRCVHHIFEVGEDTLSRLGPQERG
mmetsp:Transcript_54905/g.91446  ORF Transcript_54905/g.91446 Transcript_54905/m.91446 type:complete len:384 (-) Transcript_54905:1184-2335(-)